MVFALVASMMIATAAAPPAHVSSQHVSNNQRADDRFAARKAAAGLTRGRASSRCRGWIDVVDLPLIGL
jgi:hypothetical protein